MNRSFRKTSGLGYNTKSSFFSRLDKPSQYNERVGSNRYKPNYGGSSYNHRFPNSAQIKDSTIGINFKPVSTNLKEHDNSQLHSIMFSRQLQNNKKSLLYLRCQDYLHMINNTQNCLDELSPEIQKAVNVNHFNSDMVTQSSSTWPAGNSGSFLNPSNRGQSGDSFFTGGHGKLTGTRSRNQGMSFDKRSKCGACVIGR